MTSLERNLAGTLKGWFHMKPQITLGKVETQNHAISIKNNLFKMRARFGIRRRSLRAVSPIWAICHQGSGRAKKNYAKSGREKAPGFIAVGRPRRLATFAGC